ncbi:hypothetical protein [Snuella sedimenti]|uniref:PIN domain-containing protein n=1 Tax=Snuella sedimenti TaxID=2798802 RepID=A0A8J7IFD6_9FLAO|nr:hypothetical protein [Snuella sedimenti]MBJ6367712.1 hypothetical protein [Snuella sedimenti]
MRKIITDTNIWYEITNEKIEKIIENYELIISTIVLNELYTSPNVYKSSSSFRSLKKAIKNILENRERITFIELNPFEFLLKQIFPKYKNESLIEFYLNEFEALIKLDFKTTKANHIERENISGFSDFINKQSVFYEKEINKNLSTKNQFEKSSTLSLTEGLILKYANDNLQHINAKVPIIEKLNANQELLLKVFDGLLRQVSKTGKKIEDNDWIDIFNLTYVGREDLYWTKDKSKELLIVSISLDNYLFEKYYS